MSLEKKEFEKSAIKDLFYLLYRRRYWIVLFICFSLIGSVLHHKKYPKYKSIAKIYIQTPESSPTVSALAKLGGTQMNPYSEVSLTDKYLKIINSNTFYEYFTKTFLTEEVFISYKDEMSWGFKGAFESGYKEKEQFIDYVMSKVSFRKSSNDIIDVIAVTKKVKEAVIIANLVSAVVKETLVQFESKELSEIEDYLKLEIEQSSNRMKNLNKEIADINRAKKIERLKGVGAGLTNLTYSKLESELESFRVRESEIGFLVKKYNKGRSLANTEGAKYSENRGYAVDKIEQLNEEKEFARARIKALKEHLKSVGRRIDSSSSLIFEHQKQLEIEIAFFKMLKKNLFENQFQRISLKNRIRSYDSAQLKSAFRDILILPKLIFTIIVSFGLISLILWLWEYVNPVVSNKGHLTEMGYEYLGFIPPLKEKTKFFKKVASRKLLLCRPEVHTIHSISFHNIRAKVQQVLRQKNNLSSGVNKNEKESKDKSTVISTISSHAGEGKSFISSNLALSFGSIGKKTIIVDCDYRRSSLGGVFSGKKEKGLVEFLKGGVSLKEILNKNIYNNTDYIGSGSSENFSLNSYTVERIEEFLAHLKKKYEIIILDTPAYLAGPEALMLSEHSDFRLFIASSNETRQQDAFDAFSGLNAMGSEKVYVILNKHALLFKSNPYSQYFSSTGEYFKKAS